MNKKKELKIFIAILIILNFGMIGFLGYENYLYKINNDSLQNDLSVTRDEFFKTKQELERQISNLEEKLSKTTTERNDFEIKYLAELDRMNDFALQIQSLGGTVGILDRLSKTDPELLKKYSKVYFLNENYIPESFSKIEPEYTYNTDEDYLIYSKIYPFLENMMIAAKNDGVDLKIISAYRSFGKQSQLKSTYTVIYGSGANQFSADQGYSEHQLGTAVDFTNPEVGASFTGFENTEEYQWLIDNAYEYGFIMSYPEDNTYYQYEPWHWRFVGRSLAEDLKEEEKYFYDLDQRDIDQYLISFYD